MFIDQSEERKLRSQVAMKFLFDEALRLFLDGFFPVSVDDAVHLAGLLMQVRSGRHAQQARADCKSGRKSRRYELSLAP